jgi:hypothetical protein
VKFGKDEGIDYRLRCANPDDPPLPLALAPAGSSPERAGSSSAPAKQPAPPTPPEKPAK